MPPYTVRCFDTALVHWGYGPIAAEKKKISTLLQAGKRLINRGVIGAGVIAAFHGRRVLPLMRRVRRLDEMVPGASLEGTVLVAGELNCEDIKKRVRLALGSVPPDAFLDQHSPMRPDPDFIGMVSALLPSHPSFP